MLHDKNDYVRLQGRSFIPTSKEASERERREARTRVIYKRAIRRIAGRVYPPEAYRILAGHLNSDAGRDIVMLRAILKDILAHYRARLSTAGLGPAA